MSHTYKPGDPIERRIGLEWRHEGRTYVGEWRGRIVYESPEQPEPQHASPEHVRPYTPPVEIPEGWTLVSALEIRRTRSAGWEIYDPDFPDSPWFPDEDSLQDPVLVVARRRADA